MKVLRYEICVVVCVLAFMCVDSGQTLLIRRELSEFDDWLTGS